MRNKATNAVFLINSDGNDEIRFFENQRLLYGFVGSFAVIQLYNAICDGLDVYFDPPKYTPQITLEVIKECYTDTKSDWIILYDEVSLQEIMDMDKNKQIQRFYALLNQKGLLGIKDDILAVHGVKSTKELSSGQLETIIENLSKADVSKELRIARSYVLNLLTKLNITGSKEDGWDQVNNYLLQPRIAGKKLYEMNLRELKDCSVKLRAIISKSKS